MSAPEMSGIVAGIANEQYATVLEKQQALVDSEALRRVVGQVAVVRELNPGEYDDFDSSLLFFAIKFCQKTNPIAPSNTAATTVATITCTLPL